MARTGFSLEFRQNAVSRVLDSNTSITKVARDMGCCTKSIHKWIKQYQQTATSPTLPPDSSVLTHPVKIADSPRHVEIALPNGTTIRLTGASPQYVADLLHTLAKS
jgi:transposase-like protein